MNLSLGKKGHMEEKKVDLPHFLHQNTFLVQGCAGPGIYQLARSNCEQLFLTNSVFSEVTLIACNWAWWECLHFRNWQILQIRAFVSIF